MKRIICLFAILNGAGLSSSQGLSAPYFETEKRFHELMVTAGYTTVFGAAVGAAALGLTEHPSENLQFLIVGGSLGFIFGTIFGGYLLLSPMLSRRGLRKGVFHPTNNLPLKDTNHNPCQQHALVTKPSEIDRIPILYPLIDIKTRSLGLYGSWVL